MNKKISILILIYIILIFVIPTGQAAFTSYDILTLGAKAHIQGEGNVTTNVSTGITIKNATLHGYLKDTGGLDTLVYFEYGETVAYGNTCTLEDINVTLGRSNIIEDGWYWTQTGSYGRNISGQTKMLIGAYGNIKNRGYVEWDTSSIPDTANIKNVTFLYDCEGKTPSALDSYILDVVNRPSTTANNQTLYDDFGAGATYYAPPGDFPETGKNKAQTLLSVAEDDLEDQLSSDWFAIAMKISPESPTRYYSIYSEAAGVATPYPSLYIEYNNSVLDSPAEFSCNLTGLLPGTTYHYRAVASNAGGTKYGSDMTFHTNSAIEIDDSTSVEETTVYLNGELLYDIGEDTDCGFWIGNVSVNASNFERNVTNAITYNSGDPVISVAINLQPAEYYYVRSWMANSQGFWNSTNETYFFTKPNSPSNVEANASTATSVTLKWDNSSFGKGTNHSTLIRYSTSSPGGSADPTSWGNVGYNGSGNWTEITGLNQDTSYHFALWSYANASGSPLLWHYSDGYVSTFNTTTGGNYTIYVRYENESKGRNPLVNLSKYGPHKFIIHYSDETDLVIFNNGIHSYTTPGGDFSTNSSGKFNITLDKTIQYIEFIWNDTATEAYRCHRNIVPSAEERNITFYIRTDAPIYGEAESRVSHVDYAPVTDPTSDVTITATNQIDDIISVYIYNATIYGGWISVANENYTKSGNQIIVNKSVLDDNITTARVDYYTLELVAGVDVLENSLIRYTYSFVDDTNLYTTQNGAYHEIYCYNSSGEKLVIDEQFFDTSLKTYPWLLYEKKYYIGVHCTEDDRNRLGFAPTSDETNPDILIPYEVEANYLMLDLIDLTIGWYATGFYVNYLDTTGSTVWVNFSVYGYYNHTIIHYENLSDINNNNFTFECNTSNPYKWSLMCELDSDTNDDYDGIYGTGTTTVNIIPGIPVITNAKTINDIFNNTIGPSPFYNVDDASRYVPWVYLIVFGIAFMVLTTTAKANATLGTLATGLVLVFAGGAIAGMKELYAFVPDSVNTVFIVAIGVFLVVIAIVASLGGEDNR